MARLTGICRAVFRAGVFVPLLLALLVAGLWIRSYWVRDRIGYLGQLWQTDTEAEQWAGFVSIAAGGMEVDLQHGRWWRTYEPVPVPVKRPPAIFYDPKKHAYVYNSSSAGYDWPHAQTHHCVKAGWLIRPVRGFSHATSTLPTYPSIRWECSVPEFSETEIAYYQDSNIFGLPPPDLAWYQQIGFDAKSNSNNLGEAEVYAIVFPLWVPLILLLALYAVPPVRRFHTGRRARRRLARGLCPACGYDLRATPLRCPECGHGGGGEVMQEVPA